jgi:apolipoprotein D and lipocalin family protein
MLGGGPSFRQPDLQSPAGDIPCLMPFLLLRLLSTCLVALLLAGCVTSKQSLPVPVATVDLDRYMGRWYVISHTPYFLEKGKVASYDTYARRPDGTLTNDFTFREETVDGPEKTWKGTARVIDPVSNAVWKVSFLWPISVTLKILALDPDYRWAVVSNNDGSLLWVLARERQMPAATYATILADLNARNLAADTLQLVPQPAN